MGNSIKECSNDSLFNTCLQVNINILIEKYSQKHPELTDNYKQALHNSYLKEEIFGFTIKAEKERLDEITTISHQKSV